MFTTVQRRLPIGAEPCPGGTHFRVWVPGHHRVQVVLDNGINFDLERESGGYFSGLLDGVRHGTRYQYRLDRADKAFPDPASRFQPWGPHGPSQVVDPTLFRWSDSEWPGVRIEGQVLYEMHIGTFTPEGTWRAAQAYLSHLADLGITAVEIMPVAEFPGDFGWGYDGVDLFAPSHLYGSPDDFRSFVDAAHSQCIAVILDVVYNHLGPDGNYLKEFSKSYFTRRYENEWGEAINFDGPDSEGVREFYAANAQYWISEFHLDGLRLDATQQIFDSSPEHIVAEISRHARRAAGARPVLLIAENESQEAKFARPIEEGGCGMDALWNDDFHHSARVALIGRNEAYYSDFLGTPQELISAVKWGFLYQGQHFIWQDKMRGTSAVDLKAASFVNYLENHDQIANSAYGRRLHQLTTPGRYRAMTGLLLLSPATPMLFQGQEFGATTPFLYFASHEPRVAREVAKGRADFLSQFPSIKECKNQFTFGEPHDRRVFELSKIDHSERQRHAPVVMLHRDLIRLRREDPVFRAQRADWVHGAVLGPEAFLLRFFGGSHGDRLIIANLGRDFHLSPAPEPLLAPHDGLHWEVLWSSEDPRYGGTSRCPVDDRGDWYIPGHCAVVLHERPESDKTQGTRYEQPDR